MSNQPQFIKNNYKSESNSVVNPIPITHSMHSIMQISNSQRSLSPAPRIFDLQGLNHDNTVSILQEQASNAKKTKNELLDRYNALMQENFNLKEMIKQISEDKSLKPQQDPFQQQVNLTLQQQIAQLKEEIQIQEEIIQKQNAKIDCLLIDQQSIDKTAVFHKTILKNKDNHYVDLLTKIKYMSAQHQLELQQLHSEREVLQISLYDSLIEKVTLCQKLDDAKNQNYFHQSFADKHLSKYQELTDQSQEEIRILQEKILELEHRNANHNNY